MKFRPALTPGYLKEKEEMTKAKRTALVAGASISITTSRTFSKNSSKESAGPGRSGVRTRSAVSPREDR